MSRTDVSHDAPASTAAGAWWSLTPDALLASLHTRAEGLTDDEAAERLRTRGPDRARRAPGPTAVAVLEQLRNPLAWLLVFAASVSGVVGEWSDAGVIVGILLFGSVLSVMQSRRAGRAIEALRARTAIRTQVVRGGVQRAVPVAELVVGDVIALSAGSLIPADAALLDARDLFVTQAVLTGETLAVEKRPGQSAPDAGLAARFNVALHGTSVRSGTARAVVARVGRDTEFGALSSRLTLRPPETDFDRGIRRFGYLLTRVMVALVFVVFTAGVLRHKPAVESLLFSIALAVGLAPEMLPAILSVTLAHGARIMADHGVLVRHLSAIENLGSMDVLCTDKTGTLTEGVVRLERALDAEGRDDKGVLALAWANAALQTGLTNPLDDAVREAAEKGGCGALPEKLDEVPYDFSRKRVSVVVRGPGGEAQMITKGALERVLEACDRVRAGDAPVAMDASARDGVLARFRAWSVEGVRVLGVARRAVQGDGPWRSDDEQGMVFEGFLLFLDPPKPGIERVVTDLAKLGVALKVVTGDQQDVARHLAASIGLDVQAALTGKTLATMSDEALLHAAPRTTVFAEVEPNQKERIILALRKTGHVVGYMGDGINDAPALHVADVGISVEGAVDVAREAADLVLLRRDLDALRVGIEQGRATFANTMKYVLTTESANFGNMLSMAAASLFLPFLPLLAAQVLLNNFLSDVPAMTLANDRVDPEMVARPQRWNLGFIQRFMVVFGLVSSVFDALTFAVLLYVLRATPETFRSGWFVASLATELLVALVIRTRRPFWKSRPGNGLLISTAVVSAAAIALPYSPAARWFSLAALAPATLAWILGIAVAYAFSVEALKRALLKRLESSSVSASDARAHAGGVSALG